MIDEGKKLTAFDAMEAAMRLSDMYHLTKDREDVDFRFNSTCTGNMMVFTFGHWEMFDYIIDKQFEIQIDNFNFGDSFSDLFLFIEKEMDRVVEDNAIKRKDETA